MDRNRCLHQQVVDVQVALRKESVDRNMALKRINSSAEDVALRKESVDRNLKASAPALLPAGRSPQGERG